MTPICGYSCVAIWTGPFSLADACLVRMTELHATSTIFTLDADSRVYRRHGNTVIPVLMPGT